MKHRAMAGIRRCGSDAWENINLLYILCGIDWRALVGHNLNAFSLKFFLVL
jgi:hypothetical protein